VRTSLPHVLTSLDRRPEYVGVVAVVVAELELRAKLKWSSAFLIRAVVGLVCLFIAGKGFATPVVFSDTAVEVIDFHTVLGHVPFIRDNILIDGLAKSPEAARATSAFDPFRTFGNGSDAVYRPRIAKRLLGRSECLVHYRLRRRNGTSRNHHPLA
jgi:hypothetical protein